MDDRYFNGIIGCKEVVCGRPLVSLTPWHITLLNIIDSPIVTDGGEITTDDILVFLKIVSTEWPDIPNIKASWKDVYWTRRMRNKRVFLRQMRLFKKWLDVQLSIPKLWQVTTPGGDISKNLSSPAMLSIVVALVSKVNVTLREAWNMRLSEARWYDTCKAEMEGAKLTIAYDTGEEDQHDINDLPESEIIAIAKKELPAATFKKWHQDRIRNRKK